MESLTASPRCVGTSPPPPEIGLQRERESHLWALLLDQIPVAIVSIEGRVYRADRYYDLVIDHPANGRRMLSLVVNALHDVLP